MSWFTRDDPAYTMLLTQHIATCERDKGEIKAAIQAQNSVSQHQHAQNTERMDDISERLATAELAQAKRANRIMFAVVIGVFGIAGDLALEIVKGYREVVPISQPAPSRGR